MKILETALPGVLLIEPQVFGDERGYFLESYNQQKLASYIPDNFVQDNHSMSTQGILRGLHVQNPHQQGKLVRVSQGEVFDVAVDIRQGSPTFGQWYGEMLSAENFLQLYIPPGFAHGFCVTSETAIFQYKCTDFYSQQDEFAIAWNDPQIGIEWPLDNPVLSEKDRNAPLLSSTELQDKLPVYQ